MHVVALISLATGPDVEAPFLAKDLGLTAFEAGQKVRGSLPAVVLKTEDVSKASALQAAMTRRGHRVLVCELGAVVASSAMVQVRAFRLEPEALVSVGPTGAEDRLEWKALRAAVRATHSLRAASVAVSTGREFSLGRAALSGGLIVSKGVKKETRTESNEREAVLYLFPAAGQPWLLKEASLKFDGLGPALKPTRLENFTTLVGQVKVRAPQAVFDDRLVAFKGAAERVTSDFRGQNTSVSTSDTVDLLAHLLAISAAAPP